jgi:signal transduction histidine kinase
VDASRECGLGRFVVADTGVGIPAKEHEPVFNNSHQGSRGNSGASGLCLKVTRQLVRLNGRRNLSASDPGKNKPIILTLP